jgi:transcriptional regulator with XRE-family HTH domain
MGRPPVNPPRSTPFGVRLRELREAARLSQRTLAEACGITSVYVSKLENGRLESDHPSRRVIAAMEMVLGVTDGELHFAARIIPDSIRNRVLEHPETFLRISRLSDKALDRIARNLTNGRQ